VTTTRFYEYQCPTGNPERALLALKHQCQQYPWYTNPHVETHDPGFSFGFTVAARDQWWCHSRAMKLALVVCEVLRISPSILSIPEWTSPEPHHNRGYQYLRRW